MHVPHHHEVITIASFDDAERFQEANSLVRQEFTGLANAKLICGAFPFGSTQFGDHNPFSDLDIVVAFDDKNAEAETAAFRAIHDAAKRIYTQTSIPLEVSCFSTWQLDEGLHSLPRPMLDWLKEQRQEYPGSVIGDDFVNYIQPKTLRQSASGFTNIDDYVARTRHVLKKSWWQGAYFRPHDLLSIVFGAPHIAGRKTLDVVHPGLMANLKKSSIAQAMQQAYGEGELWHLYGEITNDAQLFQEEFVQQAATLTVDEYDHIIEATLDDNLPKAIEFLRRLQEAYDPIKSGNYVESGIDLTADGWHALLVEQVRAGQVNSY